jgi:hypothetical protein
MALLEVPDVMRRLGGMVALDSGLLPVEEERISG